MCFCLHTTSIQVFCNSMLSLLQHERIADRPYLLRVHGGLWFAGCVLFACCCLFLLMLLFQLANLDKTFESTNDSKS